MSITSLSIRNFRSIQSFDDTVRGLNIFVGQNDEGKSNVLRALDLFFNHDKAEGYSLVWEQDYCSFTQKRKGKAEEIAISLEVTPPASFTNRTPVVWKKTWRKQGLHSDELKHTDGKTVSSKNKVTAFVKAMRFDYVPAIKGKDYFQTLMAKLHDMLEATVEDKVPSSIGFLYGGHQCEHAGDTRSDSKAAQLGEYNPTSKRLAGPLRPIGVYINVREKIVLTTAAWRRD